MFFWAFHPSSNWFALFHFFFFFFLHLSVLLLESLLPHFCFYMICQCLLSQSKFLPVICFWVSVESVSFSSWRAFAIPPQRWTSSLLFWFLNTRFLRAPAATWHTWGLPLLSRATRVGMPPSWKTCNTEIQSGEVERIFWCDMKAKAVTSSLLIN